MDEIPQGFEVQPPVDAQPTAQAPQDMSSHDIPAGFEIQPNKYDTTEQTVKAGLEGFAKTAIPLGGTVLPLLQKNLFHTRPSDIEGRAEAHPYVQMAGETAGLFSPTNLLSKVGKVAEGALGVAQGLKNAPLLSKIARGAWNSGVEQAAQMAVLSGSDEAGKMLINSPDASAHNAIANVGLSTFVGFGVGSAIGSISPLWKATGAGSRTAELLEQAKARFNFRAENPDITGTAVKELQDMHNGVSELASTFYGGGIKSDMIKSSLPEMTSENLGKIQTQTQDIHNLMTSEYNKIIKDPEHILSGQAKFLKRNLQSFEEAVTQPGVTPIEHFDAIQQLKRDLDVNVKYDKSAQGGSREAAEFAQLSHDIRSEIAPMLEDTKVWGDAGNIQKEMNKAYSDWAGSKANKDMLKRFSNKIGDESVIDPGKINTYFNQLGKPNAEIKQDVISNYMDEYGAFRDSVNKTMTSRGHEMIVPPTSTNVLSDSVNKPTVGSKIVDNLIDKHLDKTAGRLAGATVGAATLSPFGPLGSSVGAIIGEHAIGPLLESTFSGLSKSLLENKTNAEGFKSAVDYAISAIKGDKMVTKKVASIFKPIGQEATLKVVPNIGSRDKLNKIVTQYKQDPDHLTKLDNGQLGHYLPAHQTAVTTTSIKALAYLGQIQPEPYRSGPLDKEIQPTLAQKQRYDRAVDIAQKPNVILDHVHNGTLQTSDIQDINSMFPALYQSMQQKISNELINAHDKGITIPYKTRMSISLFLGQPMDSTMNPENIIAAQMSHQSQGSQPQQGGKSKGSPSKVGKAEKQFQTPNQSAESDRSNRK